MSDPPGEKKYGGCGIQVRWAFTHICADVQKITGMIKRHNNHDQPSQKVNGLDSIFYGEVQIRYYFICGPTQACSSKVIRITEWGRSIPIPHHHPYPKQSLRI